MKLDDVRRDIEYRRKMIIRQRKDIAQLQRAGISTDSAEALLHRMVVKVGELCAERNRLRHEEKKENCYPGTNKQIRGTQRRGL